MNELSKRDIFALIAMFAWVHGADRGSIYSEPKRVAEFANGVADEMMKRTDAAQHEDSTKGK